MYVLINLKMYLTIIGISTIVVRLSSMEKRLLNILLFVS